MLACHREGFCCCSTAYSRSSACGGRGAEGMSSRRQRDAWTEFARRWAAELRGRVVALARRLGGPARRGLSALDSAMPAKYLAPLQCIAAGLALVTGGLSVAVMLVGGFPHWFEGRRLPLHNI